MKDNTKQDKVREEFLKGLIEVFTDQNEYVNDLGDYITFDGSVLKEEIFSLFDQALTQREDEVREEMLGILKNIRRFDEKEDGADYFAGWDNCLDTIFMDLQSLNQNTK